MRTSLLARLAVLSLTLSCGRAALDLPVDEDGPGGSPTSGGGGEGAVGGVGGSGGSPNTGGGPGPGGGPSCIVAQECDDFDACTSNLCLDGQCSFPERDDDQDGFVALACGGPDCNDLNAQVSPVQPENCFDGSDNDCNGVADCLDPACENVPNCGCTPISEICDNGQDDDCDGIQDCFDSQCLGTPACGCLPSESGLCFNGFDEDCDGAIDCDDADCSSEPACGCLQQQEDCSNGADDDCDLLIDCADPNCAGVFPCTCQPPGTPEVCTDGFDNDCDGLPDCADPNCAASPACSDCEPEICDDGIDNDCDLVIDCADSACVFAPGCELQPEICNNSLDDDGDGLTDCQDPECANTPICQQQQANCLSPLLIGGTGTFFGDTTGNLSETKGACGGDAGEAVFFFVLNEPSFVHLDSSGTSFDSVLYVRTGACNSGKEIGCDDDGGGSLAASLDFTILYPGTYFVFLDGYTIDPNGGANEGPFQLNVDIVPNPPEVCGDGLDNDGDVYVDCADSDCTDVPLCFDCNGGQPPTPEFMANRCTDGADNDCDGTTDCADEDCSASDFYVTECCNGVDENGNNVVDDFNCRCANSSECPGDQICYDHTVKACGPPCQNFFGEICPFIQPGSFCNAATSQCEFP